MASTFTHSTATRRPATFATLALAAVTALATFSSLPALAQPASPAPVSATAAADEPAAPAQPLQRRAASKRERMQDQNKEQRMQRMQEQGMEQTREQRMERWQQRRAERMAAFKTQLQLTSAQEQAWTDFTATMQPGQRHARLDREGMENLTTPERIDRMRAVRIQRAAEADQRGDAVKTFYAALNAPQQKTFDQQMHQMQKRMSQGREGGPGAKYQRSGNEAGGPGAQGAKHHGEHYRHGMQQRRAGADAAGTAPSAAPAQ